MAKKNKKKEIYVEEVKETEVKTSKQTIPAVEGSSLFFSVILALVGIILIFLPEGVNAIIGYIIGSAFLLGGLATIIKYFKSQVVNSFLTLVSGILYAALGLIVIIFPESIMKLFTIILGVFLIVNGALKVHGGYISQKFGNEKWKLNIISGVIIVIFGLVLIIDPVEKGYLLTKIAGLFLTIVAIFDLINMFLINKNNR